MNSYSNDRDVADRVVTTDSDQVNREIDRLKPIVDKGALPQKTLLDRQYAFLRSHAGANAGHEVVIVEASNHIGGVVLAGGQPSFKEDDLALREWYRTTLEERGVEMRLSGDAHVQRSTRAASRRLAEALRSTIPSSIIR